MTKYFAEVRTEKDLQIFYQTADFHTIEVLDSGAVLINFFTLNKEVVGNLVVSAQHTLNLTWSTAEN